VVAERRKRSRPLQRQRRRKREELIGAAARGRRASGAEDVDARRGGDVNERPTGLSCIGAIDTGGRARRLL
jgi:hypothetical protein